MLLLWVELVSALFSLFSDYPFCLAGCCWVHCRLCVILQIRYDAAGIGTRQKAACDCGHSWQAGRSHQQQPWECVVEEVEVSGARRGRQDAGSHFCLWYGNHPGTDSTESPDTPLFCHHDQKPWKVAKDVDERSLRSPCCPKVFLSSSQKNKIMDEILTGVDWNEWDRFDTVEKLKQQYVFVPEKAKDCYLVHLLRDTFADKTMIVFTTRYKWSPFFFFQNHRNCGDKDWTLLALFILF